jgi:hypothetical protein
LTKIARTPEEQAAFNQSRKTSEFLKRLTQAKLDPAIKPYAELVSGLFENEEWAFICSQHVAARFSNEEELKEHFRNVAHKQSTRGKLQSTFDS